MFELAQALAVAKIQQDVSGALRLLHPDVVLENPAFGTTARGVAADRLALTRFFAIFPDCHVDPAGHGDDGETPVCSGTSRITMTGKGFQDIPSGDHAEVPVFTGFSFADDLSPLNGSSSTCPFCARSWGCPPMRCGALCSALPVPESTRKDPGNDDGRAHQDR
ncbi:nuclear transport factor 2 family protein [Nocardia sp. NPDC023852]|uniref:nuclear transport factor 2 family protein n=1 Tax=Nocardia sp. NPDC023852 TaxID=3154697 RepID=UPI0033D75971